MTCSTKDCRRSCRPGWAICDQHVLDMVAPLRPRPRIERLSKQDPDIVAFEATARGIRAERVA